MTETCRRLLSHLETNDAGHNMTMITLHYYFKDKEDWDRIRDKQIQFPSTLFNFQAENEHLTLQYHELVGKLMTLEAGHDKIGGGIGQLQRWLKLQSDHTKSLGLDDFDI